MELQRIKTEILDRLGGEIGEILHKAAQQDKLIFSGAGEIRIRAGLPLVIIRGSEYVFLTANGQRCSAPAAYRPRREAIEGVFQRVCQNSLYAFTEDIKNGFVTLPGGHRVGIAGHVLAGGGMRDISSLNIRIARQVKGCGEKLLPHIIRNASDIYSTLIISPPCCGKTTVIRDLARILSTGRQNPEFTGVNVGVVDERSEIAACYKGIPANDVGILVDIYDACPKEKGIQMMLRALAPKIIVTDEIGGSGDGAAIVSAMNAGVRIIATAHGYGFEDVGIRKEIRDMMEAGVFEKYVILSSRMGPGTLEEVRRG